MTPPIRRLRDMFHGINGFDDVLAFARSQGERSGRFSNVEERGGRRPVAKINAGRWVALCPFCNNAMPCDPDWPRTACVDCGGMYTLDFPNPPTVHALEAALAPRPEENRNWQPPETVDDLLAENAAHGIRQEGP